MKASQSMLHIVCEERRVRLSPQHDVTAKSPSNEVSAEYDVRQLLAPDGQWHEFLVLSAWTSMQATVWLNRR